MSNYYPQQNNDAYPGNAPYRNGRQGYQPSYQSAYQPRGRGGFQRGRGGFQPMGRGGSRFRGGSYPTPPPKILDVKDDQNVLSGRIESGMIMSQSAMTDIWIILPAKPGKVLCLLVSKAKIAQVISGDDVAIAELKIVPHSQRETWFVFAETGMTRIGAEVLLISVGGDYILVSVEEFRTVYGPQIQKRNLPEDYFPASTEMRIYRKKLNPAPDRVRSTLSYPSLANVFLPPHQSHPVSNGGETDFYEPSIPEQEMHQVEVVPDAQDLHSAGSTSWADAPNQSSSTSTPTRSPAISGQPRTVSVENLSQHRRV